MFMGINVGKGSVGFKSSAGEDGVEPGSNGSKSGPGWLR